MTKITDLAYPILKYCYFSFIGPNQEKHELRVWVRDLDSEWSLYIDDMQVGCLCDPDTNVALTSHMQRALSWDNVARVYTDLLLRQKPKP